MFIIYFICLSYKKYKKKIEIEKKLLGEKKNININKFLDFTENDYKISLNSIKNLDEIGIGGSSIVFKGKYGNDIVAIKIFKQNLLESNSEDFKKELKLISKLKNNNIINFIGFIAENSQFGIVLEYCENGNLKNFLINNKKITFKSRIKFLIDISKGMEYLHFKNLIHRDLKLENVLITNDLFCKISDFGISRILSDETNSKTKKVGTALYIAPEVILTNNYDQKVDVFSFSIIMFQILTKKIDNIYDDEDYKIEIQKKKKTKKKLSGDNLII
jgi:serine/threonine protein kinase